MALHLVQELEALAQGFLVVGRQAHGESLLPRPDVKYAAHIFFIIGE